MEVIVNIAYHAREAHGETRKLSRLRLDFVSGKRIKCMDPVTV